MEDTAFHKHPKSSVGIILLVTLLSVFILLVMVVWWYYTERPGQNKQPVVLNPVEVKITTSKSTYQQGEIAKITFINDADHDYWLLSPYFSVERWVGDDWRAISRLVCKCGTRCEIVPVQLPTKRTTSYQWDLKEEVCWYNDQEQSYQNISQFVISGSYRISSEIFNTSGEDSFSQKIYSAEFTVTTESQRPDRLETEDDVYDYIANVDPTHVMADCEIVTLQRINNLWHIQCTARASQRIIEIVLDQYGVLQGAPEYTGG